MRFEKLFPRARYAVQRVERNRRQTIALKESVTDARDVERRNNAICGGTGVRYVTVRIKRMDDEKEDQKK